MNSSRSTSDVLTAAIAAAGVLGTLLPGVLTSQAMTTAQVAAQATPATVTIITQNARGDTLATGSGFFILSDGTIVTNWHVLRGAMSATVVRSNGEAFHRVTFLEGDSTADIALIKVPGWDLPTLTPRASVPAVGEKVIAIGSPMGLSSTVTEGIVSAVRMVDGRELVQMSAAISPGSSGGAVLDENGQVFAVSTAYLKGGQQLNFAIPIRYALGLIPMEPKERAISLVFGVPGVRTRAVASAVASETRESDGRSEHDRRFAPASVIRPSLSGVFSIETTVSGGSLPGLFVSTGKYGWISIGDTAFQVNPITTNARGDVLVAMEKLVFDGYQASNGGFIVRSTNYTAPDSTPIIMTAVPTALPLSDPRGLYDVSCRSTYFYRDRETGERVDWEGVMAVLTSGQNIYVDVVLINDKGGSVTFSGVAPLSDAGYFSVHHGDERKASTYTSFTGNVSPGAIQGVWRDGREGGSRFECTLRGTRR